MEFPQNLDDSNFSEDARQFGAEIREVLKAGVFKFVITAVTPRTNKYSNDLELALTLAPLDANDKPCEPVAFYQLPVPVGNPTVAGHVFRDDGEGNKAFKGAKRKKILNFAEALKEGTKKEFEIQLMKSEKTGEFTKTDGTQMTQQDWDTFATERNTKAKDLMKTWYNDRQKLVGEVVYGGVGSDNPRYPKIKWLGNNPGGKDVETSDFAFTAA